MRGDGEYEKGGKRRGLTRSLQSISRLGGEREERERRTAARVQEELGRWRWSNPTSLVEVEVLDKIPYIEARLYTKYKDHEKVKPTLISSGPEKPRVT